VKKEKDRKKGEGDGEGGPPSLHINTDNLLVASQSPPLSTN